MKYITTLLILFVSCLSADRLCSGTIDPHVPDSKYIEYGAKHECVVKIEGLYGEKSAKYAASAVIIKPRFILTAAHVIHESKDCYITLKDKKINILFSMFLTDYDTDKIGPNDIAICYLEEDAIIDFYPELYAEDNEVGKICSLAGFGITGTHKTGMINGDGKKRAGSNIVDGIISGMLVCSVNKPPKTALEFLIANGDSGGGLFIDQKLAGIHSCIMTSDGNLNANYNEDSLHTRISLHKDWIEATIQKIQNLQIDK